MKLQHRHGASLLEVLIAGIILVIGLLPLLMLNRSSNQLTLDAYFEFMAVQLAQEPIEVFRSVGYPACTKLAHFPIGVSEGISERDSVYPAEAAMFSRQITLDVSKPPLCLVTVKVFPRLGTGAEAWMRPGKEVIIMKGAIPVVY